MATYNGSPKGTIVKSFDEFTTQTPAHAQYLNPRFRELYDNDAENEARISAHKTAAVLDHPDKSVTQTKIADKAVGSGQLADGAATDLVIGNRTIADATAPTTDTAQLGTLLNGMANMLKAVTGKTTWRTAPATTLEAMNTHVGTQTIGIHGSTSAATASKLVHRDAAGRAQFADPSAGSDAATKQYVDALIQGIPSKAEARAATTANITLSGTQTIDGVALVAGDRVLVKDQTTASQNGIYVVAAGGWTRATDADLATEFTSGMFVFVGEGTANGMNGYVLSTPNPITLGTTNLTFVQFSGAGQIVAGAALTKSGNTLDVATDNVGVEVANDALRLKDGGVTDAKIGNRTINDAIAIGTTDTDSPTNLFSKIGAMIRAITGKADWFTAPAISLETVAGWLSSGTVVVNLNADKLDGYTAGDFVLISSYTAWHNQALKTTDSPTFAALTVNNGNVTLSQALIVNNSKALGSNQIVVRGKTPTMNWPGISFSAENTAATPANVVVSGITGKIITNTAGSESGAVMFQTKNTTDADLVDRGQVTPDGRIVMYKQANGGITPLLKLANSGSGASGASIEFAGTYSAIDEFSAIPSARVGGMTYNGVSRFGGLLAQTYNNGAWTNGLWIDAGGQIGIGSAATNTNASALLDLGSTTGKKFLLYGSGGVQLGMGIDMTNTGGRELNIFASTSDNVNGQVNIGWRRESDGTIGTVLHVTPTGISITGSYTATGSKSAVVSTPSYDDQLMYSVEAPEVRFEDYGEGMTNAAGQAVIQMDPIFLETVEIYGDDYQVWIQGIDGTGFIVPVRDATSFTVEGPASKRFMWRILAFRYGYYGLRNNEASY